MSTTHQPPANPEPDRNEAAALPERPVRRRRWGRWLIWTGLLILATVGALAGLSYWGLTRWAGRPWGRPGTQALTLAPGTPTVAIARQLHHAGLISDPQLFLAWHRLEIIRTKLRHAAAPALQAGEYRLDTPISPRALAAALAHGRFERLLTIPEGWTCRQVAARLHAEGWINRPEEWLELVARPLAPEAVGEAQPAGAEGFCYPETYRLDRTATAPQILARMLEEFRRQWRAAAPERRDPRAAARTQREVIILASMIEREARTPGEMPRIASVYYNRLARGMKMQCDATVHYALGDKWDRALTYADLKIDSAYNTYLYPGLPPGPIANPGRTAIEAALRPADEDYLYYVYSGDGRHTFSRTGAEHNKATRAARRRNTPTPGP